MLKGVCPKCGTKEVYRKENGVTQSEHMVYVRKIGFSSPATDRITYLCANCGYFEHYLTDEEILNKVKEKWEKV